nr:MAG TPA: hypothetical protein [Caudoviricetes sp.]
MLFGPSVIQYVIFLFSPKNSRIRILLILILSFSISEYNVSILYSVL